MSIQKFHREAYDIVLSNFPEGPERERATKRFERAATASSARELFKADAAPRLLADAPPLAMADGPIQRRARATIARRPCSPTGGGSSSAAARRRLGFRRAGEAGRRGARTARTTTWRSCAPAPPTTNARPRAPENEPASRPKSRTRRRAGSCRWRRGSRAAPPPADARRAPDRPRRVPAPASARPRPRPAAGAPARAAHLRAWPSCCAATRLTLESRFADVRVEGEVSGLKRSGPGHLYFCLKDAEAQLDCVMFSREAGAAEVHASRKAWRSAAAAG